MKIIITESQYNLIQKDLEEDYPASWNVEEFAKLTSFNQRIQYCEKNLTRISSGSSRIVYKIDETKVLKLAKNKKGLAQNEVEIDCSKDYYLDNVVANVFNYDENNLWVEMELAKKLTPSLFQKIVGITFENFSDGLRYFDTQRKGRSIPIYKPANMEELWDNEFTRDMLDVLGNYDIPAGDLCKISTYGVVIRDGQEQIVMIDYGLTNDVYASHYKR